MDGADDGAREAGAWEAGARAAQPPWPDAPCPPWCTREHAADDHPEDRYHQSEPTLLPVVAGSGDTVPVTASLRPLTLAVRIGRYADDDRTWLVIEALEAPRPRMVLAAEAARALVRGLLDQLDALDSG
ncbi:MAG TPA: hypothetical protein VM575_15520 [Nocardioides sp.]|nr:hypothetical protein [Nocardioides sp.]